jgi:hypothetical protein
MCIDFLECLKTTLSHLARVMLELMPSWHNEHMKGGSLAVVVDTRSAESRAPGESEASVGEPLPVVSLWKSKE